jgi:hypothetical protein
LEQRQSVGELGYRQLGNNGVDGSRRADEHGRRYEELGDVEGEGPVSSGRLRESEVKEPRPAVAANEDVGAAEIAVGDSRGVENGDLIPQGGEELVGDVAESVEGDPVHGALHEHA